ncbi:MerR family transcriptional regulator [Immundisolibacter sp.]|uniref:MerR family transcriptional regulator n=1 Tax=Immundisolibacter sp. TaxID=1934948 RepID=UPI0035682CC4
MTVNELARAADVPPAKVRYYARRGLLPAQRAAGNGYRLFDNAALARLRFISTSRVLGFALKDIQRLLRDADLGQSPCPQVRTLLDQRVAALAAQRRALAREEARLRAIGARWAGLPDGVPDLRRLCPLVEVARGA